MNARPPPMFVADAPALDFLNTVAAPWGERIEWLADGRDLGDWLATAGLAPPDALAAFADETASAELDATAAKARELREWFRGFVLAHRGAPLDPGVLAELAPLNRILAEDAAYAVIAPEPAGAERPSGLEIRWDRRWRPQSLLLPIAHAMADLVCHADFSQVRTCEGAGCTLTFLDLSKRHGRRWCSMAVCGNRAKQAALRDRRKDHARPGPSRRSGGPQG